METNRLLAIAQDLGFEDVTNDLQRIITRMSQPNCPVILPLVGEFSSGKTTLINALTDSKQLETATKPTTATIYEVHFGCDRSHAVVINEKDERIEVENISDLKNDNLSDAKIVNVFDTSTKVPSSTIIVDTPGLSSPDPRHKQTLVDFMPLADGILLVIDVNSQVTKSLTDFIQTINLSKRPIYLIITKCDTKAQSEVEKTKQYISDNTQIPVKQMACVSAAQNGLDEMLALLASIQKDKDEILKHVNTQRLNNIAKLMIHRIDDLLNASHSDDGIDESIRRKKYELDKLNRNIEQLIGGMEEDIEKCEKHTTRQFEDIVFEKLDSLAAGKSANFDAEAVSIINNTSSLLLNDYKTDIRDAIIKKVRSMKNTDDAINLHSLENLDMNNLSVSGLSYNLDLNGMGHEYDGVIAVGLTTVAAAGAAYFGFGAAGAAGALDALDTVTDVACDGGAAITKLTSNALSSNNKGVVESLVGLVTDKTMGKPQRRRAIHEYLDGNLIPTYTAEIKRISKDLLKSIGDALHAEAEQTIKEMTDALEQLKQDKKSQKAAFEQKINQLRDYKNDILTL